MIRGDGRVAAVIEIGSDRTRLRLAQSVKGEMKMLETLERPLRLGHEVFTTGRLSFEALRELSDCLHGFGQVMSEYGASQCRTIATSALREAQNRAYVADQLKIQNRIDLEILEEGTETALLVSEVQRILPKRKGNLLVAYIGTGSVGVTLAGPEGVLFSQTLPTGSLKMGDMFRAVRRETIAYYRILEEFIETMMHHVRVHTAQASVDQLLIAGADMPLIHSLLRVNTSSAVIEREKLCQLYERFRQSSPQAIARMAHTSEEQAQSLHAALALYTKLASLAASDKVLAPDIEIWDIYLRQMLFAAEKKAFADSMESNMRTAAEYTAKRYGCDLAHAQTVCATARLLFDKLKKTHGIAPKKGLLLEEAALLHEVGYYLDVQNHREATWSLLENMNLFGLSLEESHLVAHITRYSAKSRPGPWSPEYVALPEKQRLMVAKMSAILCLANALDESHMQRCRDMQVILQDKKLVLRVESDEDLQLEKWAVHACTPYFMEVFGLEPQFMAVSKLL